jgi:hypothetical protein
MKVILVVLCIVLFLPALVSAHIIFEPPWVSSDGTTFQEWSFDDNSNPALPEFKSNPYGGASAAITVGELSAGWQESLLGLGTQTGFWSLGIDGSIVLEIDNRPEPLPYKEIWLQVTYYKSDISQAPTVSMIPGATFLGGETVLVEDAGGIPGDGWYLDFSKWRMEPNPPHEKIVLTGSLDYDTVIDQIVVHTICIPEPVSLAFLAFGSLVFLRKRR